ncbi:MAG: FkbM family methyltransferase [Gemmatimonadaceae bacterium]
MLSQHQHLDQVAKEALRRSLPPAWWRWLQIAKLALERRTFARRWVEHTYAGHPLRVLLGDRVGSSWYDQDWTMPELSILRSGRLRPGATVFNIGAHQGVVAMILAREVGRTGRVIAVEADAFHAGLAEVNRSANGIDQMIVRHAAAGAVAGTLTHDATTGAIQTARARGSAVPALTIDALSAEYGAPDVIYMDVEGYEGAAFRGATATLAAGTVDVLVEVHGPWLARYSSSVTELLAAFPDSDYRRASVNDAGIDPRPLETVAAECPRFILIAQGRH